LFPSICRSDSFPFYYLSPSLLFSCERSTIKHYYSRKVSNNHQYSRHSASNKASKGIDTPPLYLNIPGRARRRALPRNRPRQAGTKRGQERRARRRARVARSPASRPIGALRRGSSSCCQPGVVRSLGAARLDSTRRRRARGHRRGTPPAHLHADLRGVQVLPRLSHFVGRGFSDRSAWPSRGLLTISSGNSRIESSRG